MRILLVDDDPGVIQSLLPVLKSLPGNEVRVATNGEKAIEHATALGGVDLLITDVVMEPMDGFTLRDELAARWPDVRTILITGYDLAEYAEQTQQHQLLQKPFDPSALIAAVAKELVPPPAIVAAPTRLGGLPPPTSVAARTGPIPTVTSTVAAPVVARPRAVAPVAIPSAAPVAHATNSWASQTPVAAGLSADDMLLGRTIGAYQIMSLLGQSRWGAVYAAVQIAINRPVGLKILDPARAADEASKQRFIADARAKANVQHPAILSVYEAGESEGFIFYAHEYVDGQNLAQLAAGGQKLDEPTALKVLRTTGEGLAYLRNKNIPHTALEPSSAYVGMDGHVRLANLATQHADQQLPIEQEIAVLGRAVLAILHTGPQLSQGLRALLNRMIQAPNSGLLAWELVLQGVKALEPKVVPIEASKIDAQERAAAAAVAAARKEQKKALFQYIGGSLALLALGIWVVWLVVHNSAHVGEELVAIPAGTYTVGERKVPLPAFWIDKHEVTVGQYARFVDYLEQNPGSSHDFDHPQQPKHLSSHEPPNWAIFHGRAKSGKPVHKAPYSLDAPVVEVTWWDAYAYAKWLGHELPTEEQWEAAARGAEGSAYPWGNAADPQKANSGSDFKMATPEVKGEKDGWNYWSPVDAVTGDKSAFGVVGMAGNISEWVNTWTPDKRFPIIKGGNYMSADVRLNKRVADHDPSKGEEHIGFRTVSNTPPNPQ